jgi:hypothetical protein
MIAKPDYKHKFMRPNFFFYIKIIFSGCVIGTPVNFGGMTGRALAVIKFLKIV